LKKPNPTTVKAAIGPVRTNATNTKRIMLGPMVTPLAGRRPYFQAASAHTQVGTSITLSIVEAGEVIPEPPPEPMAPIPAVMGVALAACVVVLVAGAAWQKKKSLV